ncbi:MAG: carboxypeptidase-like regulatory domain-containing protein [Rhodothermia bacterium]|nr:carboxypeptidase-like regulatory domain-containing protein [Rhodothermia bacterium]
MRYKFLLIFVAFILTLTSLHAQPLIKGNVRDKATNVPLQYATIRVLDRNQGVMANENGDFVLNSINLPVKVQVSFIGYTTQVVDLITSNMTIFLEVSETQLLDIEIFPKDYLIIFLKKVYNKANKMNKIKFISNAFYRQYVTDDARRLLNYTEAFYKTNTVYGGIKELKMTKGRYAIREDFDPNFVSLIDGNAFDTIGTRFFLFPKTIDLLHWDKYNVYISLNVYSSQY